MCSILHLPKAIPEKIRKVVCSNHVRVTDVGYQSPRRSHSIPSKSLLIKHWLVLLRYLLQRPALLKMHSLRCLCLLWSFHVIYHVRSNNVGFKAFVVFEAGVHCKEGKCHSRVEQKASLFVLSFQIRTLIVLRNVFESEMTASLVTIWKDE